MAVPDPAQPSPDAIAARLHEHGARLASALADMQATAPALAEAVALLVRTLRAGGKVLLAGNGGSAAQAQHFAAELVGRFKRERSPYAALAITTDTSILTAVANDYGYDDIFVRQVLALGCPGDVLIALSTSGESENLVRAAEAAHTREMTVVALTGGRPCRLERAADLTLRAPAEDSAAVQELHLVIVHLLCDLVEAALS